MTREELREQWAFMRRLPAGYYGRAALRGVYAMIRSLGAPFRWLGRHDASDIVAFCVVSASICEILSIPACAVHDLIVTNKVQAGNGSPAQVEAYCLTRKEAIMKSQESIKEMTKQLTDLRKTLGKSANGLIGKEAPETTSIRAVTSSKSEQYYLIPADRPYSGFVVDAGKPYWLLPVKDPPVPAL